MYKKLLFGLCIVVMLFSFYACDGDDWAPYTFSTENPNIKIEPENTMLGISNNIQRSIEKLKSDFVLTEVVLTIDDSEESSINIKDALFTYVQIPKDNENRVTKIDVNYLMNESIVYQTSFESGHGKRVSAISEPIGGKYMTMPFTEIIDLIISDEGYDLVRSNGLTEFTVDFSFDRFLVGPPYLRNATQEP